jgi:hypothetical protein
MEAKMDQLALKRGGLKSWDINSPEATAALQKIWDEGDTKENVCNLIDAVNCQLIYQDFYDEWMTKDQAKAYVMSYERRA